MIQNKKIVLLGITGAFFLGLGWFSFVFFPANSETLQQTFTVNSHNIDVGIYNGVVNDLRYVKYENALLFDITANGNGYLQVNIPQGMLDSQNSELPFAGYFTLVDNEEVVFEETDPELIRIEFLQGNEKIEIIGTFQP